MRQYNFGVIPNLLQSLKHDVVLEIFRRICLVRYFELGAANAIKEGFITYPTYLSIGQESISSAMSIVVREFMIFTQHRCHGTYLAFGGDPVKLRDELLGLPTGTSGGRAGSNCIQCFENNIMMFGHHGLIGENVPLGVGAALGSKRPTVCFFGDGAAEEDYVFAAMGFAATHKLPLMFVCEDNNLSILTPVEIRRSWTVTNIAKAFGISSIDIADDPWTIVTKANELKNSLPCLINIYTCRAYWHVGAGIDGQPEWDRYKIVKDELEMLGLKEQVEQIENENQKLMDKIWDKKQLQILLKR